MTAADFADKRERVVTFTTGAFPAKLRDKVRRPASQGFDTNDHDRCGGAIDARPATHDQPAPTKLGRKWDAPTP